MKSDQITPQRQELLERLADNLKAFFEDRKDIGKNTSYDVAESMMNLVLDCRASESIDTQREQPSKEDIQALIDTTAKELDELRKVSAVGSVKEILQNTGGAAVKSATTGLLTGMGTTATGAAALAGAWASGGAVTAGTATIGIAGSAVGVGAVGATVAAAGAVLTLGGVLITAAAIPAAIISAAVAASAATTAYATGIKANHFRTTEDIAQASSKIMEKIAETVIGSGQVSAPDICEAINKTFKSIEEAKSKQTQTWASKTEQHGHSTTSPKNPDSGRGGPDMV